MIRNLIRTCDMCHRAIPIGEYRQRNGDKSGPEIMMVLAANTDRDLQLIELPDGTISVDTCIDCYARMGFVHSQALN